MCHPCFLQQLSRRHFIQVNVGGSAILTASPLLAQTEPREILLRYSRIVDLTHTLTPAFPTHSGIQFEIQSHQDDIWSQNKTLRESGIAFNTWTVMEHTGTHFDAPIHFFDPNTGPEQSLSAEQIPASNLVGGLIVIDIREKAENDPDSFLTFEDVKHWESKHGPIPSQSIVAMLSGWEEHVHSDQFRNEDDQGILHFPGFHIEAVEYLIEERDTKGLMVDTLSLDAGFDTTYPVHYRWLPDNRWGVECAANLGELPPAGALVAVGAPKVKGASGGPCRIFAFAQ